MHNQLDTDNDDKNHNTDYSTPYPDKQKQAQLNRQQ